MSNTSTRACRLLQLPAELRNQIYDFALVQQEPFSIDLVNAEPQAPQIFALSQTCKQIQQETLSLIYDNTFEFITAIHAHQTDSSSSSSLNRLHKICDSHLAQPKFKHIIICLDRDLAFDKVAHYISMLFNAAEPLRALQRSGVNVEVYASVQLCRGEAFSPRLQFHLRDMFEAKRELEDGFIRQRIAAGLGDGKDLKTVYFEMLRARLIEAFFLQSE